MTPRAGLSGAPGAPETGGVGSVPAFRLAGAQSLGEQSADHVAAGAAFLGGYGVDLGDRFGVEADRVEVPGWHGRNCSTMLDIVLQRDTVLDMTTTRIAFAQDNDDPIQDCYRFDHDYSDSYAYDAIHYDRDTCVFCGAIKPGSDTAVRLLDEMRERAER